MIMWAAAMLMAGDYPYPLDAKQSQQAQAIWKGLQDGKQHGQILLDRLVWRSMNGRNPSTIVTLEDARRDTHGCSVARVDQEAPESLAYQLNCEGQTKYLYFAASDGSILLVDIDNHPVGVVVVAH